MSKKRYHIAEIEEVEENFEEIEEILPEDMPCELCGRTDIELTRHHLIPQSRHNKARTKKEFSRSEMKTQVAMLCQACHNQVHEVFSNNELSSYYNTVERIKEHSEMEKFINWVKKRPAGQTVRVKGKGNVF